MHTLPSLLDRTSYEFWTEDQIWEVFVSLIERNCPMAHIRERLSDYRSIFADVCQQMLYEHQFLLGTHFRTVEGRPFINPLNAEHLTRLLHLFARRIFIEGYEVQILDALFFVLKSHCQINLFYSQEVGRFFFAFHAIGAVLGYKAQHGDFLIVTQGSTIGQSGNKYPTIGNNVVVGPGAMVLGDSKIGDNVLIGAGALVINSTIPDDTIVLGRPPHQTLKPNEADNRLISFDLDALKRQGAI